MFIFGYQLSAITPDILGILKNTEILAINQDPVVGKSVSPFRWGINVGSPLSTCALLTCPSLTGQVTAVWSGPTENGTVFMLVSVASHGLYPLNSYTAQYTGRALDNVVQPY